MPRVLRIPLHPEHEAFLLVLAHRTVDDGRVSRDERQQWNAVASLLGVANTKVKQVLDRSDAARHARLGAGLGPLPTLWPNGEPLRVGDRVAFMGCAEELGVRVISSVPRVTTMLITDGSHSGGKLAKSQELGTLHVHPDTFEVLLQHLQPAAPALAPSSTPTPPPALTLISSPREQAAVSRRGRSPLPVGVHHFAGSELSPAASSPSPCVETLFDAQTLRPVALSA